MMGPAIVPSLWGYTYHGDTHITVTPYQDEMFSNNCLGHCLYTNPGKLILLALVNIWQGETLAVVCLNPIYC